MKAIRTKSLGHAEVVSDIPIPAIADFPGYALVKTKYVGIHHCDYYCTDYEMLFKEGITIGVEFCGVVEDVHPGDTKFKKGDHIAGCTFPTAPPMPNAGCFAEYILVKADAQLRVDALGEAVQEASTSGIGVPLTTIFYGLYHLMKLPLPYAPPPASQGDGPGPGRTILIYGGSTNTGMMAIQFAKLSGLRVITTCSPRNFALARGLGADAVFDYHDAGKCAGEIRAAAGGGGGVGLVFDCVGAFGSPQICADAMAAGGGGVYNSVAPTPCPRGDVTSLFTQGQKSLGEPFVMAGQTVPAKRKAEGYIREGKIKLPPVEVVEGWEKILDVMKELRGWKFSAKKCVARVG